MSFYEYSGAGDKPKLIGEKSVEYPTTTDEAKRESFYKKLMKNGETNIESLVENTIYSMSIKSKSPTGEANKEFLVLQQFGFEKDATDTAELVRNMSESKPPNGIYRHLPIAGIALNKDFLNSV